jgi:hypothetical protein
MGAIAKKLWQNMCATNTHVLQLRKTPKITPKWKFDSTCKFESGVQVKMSKIKEE